jgi:hypothetical protein
MTAHNGGQILSEKSIAGDTSRAIGLGNRPQHLAISYDI